jgi:hypothetical protein
LVWNTRSRRLGPTLDTEKRADVAFVPWRHCATTLTVELVAFVRFDDADGPPVSRFD